MGLNWARWGSQTLSFPISGCIEFAPRHHHGQRAIPRASRPDADWVAAERLWVIALRAGGTTHAVFVSRAESAARSPLNSRGGELSPLAPTKSALLWGVLIDRGDFSPCRPSCDRPPACARSAGQSTAPLSKKNCDPPAGSSARRAVALNPPCGGHQCSKPSRARRVARRRSRVTRSCVMRKRTQARDPRGVSEKFSARTPSDRDPLDLPYLAQNLRRRTGLILLSFSAC